MNEINISFRKSWLSVSEIPENQPTASQKGIGTCTWLDNNNNRFYFQEVIKFNNRRLYSLSDRVQLMTIVHWLRKLFQWKSVPSKFIIKENFTLTIRYQRRTHLSWIYFGQFSIAQIYSAAHITTI